MNMFNVRQMCWSRSLSATPPIGNSSDYRPSIESSHSSGTTKLCHAKGLVHRLLADFCCCCFFVCFIYALAACVFNYLTHSAQCDRVRVSFWCACQIGAFPALLLICTALVGTRHIAMAQVQLSRAINRQNNSQIIAYTFTLGLSLSLNNSCMCHTWFE